MICYYLFFWVLGCRVSVYTLAFVTREGSELERVCPQVDQACHTGKPCHTLGPQVLQPHCCECTQFMLNLKIPVNIEYLDILFVVIVFICCKIHSLPPIIFNGELEY